VSSTSCGLLELATAASRALPSLAAHLGPLAPPHLDARRDGDAVHAVAAHGRTAPSSNTNPALIKTPAATRGARVLHALGAAWGTSACTRPLATGAPAGRPQRLGFGVAHRCLHTRSDDIVEAVVSAAKQQVGILRCGST
jgi:hypothetical protein